MTTQISGDTGVSKAQAGAIDQSALAAAVVPLGVGQTWQDVTGSRAIGTTYTNTTGRPILLSVVCTSTNTTNSVGCLVGGVQISSQGASATNTAFTAIALVPAGSTYSISTVNSNLVQWNELR